MPLVHLYREAGPTAASYSLSEINAIFFCSDSDLDIVWIIFRGLLKNVSNKKQLWIQGLRIGIQNLLSLLNP